jgi:oligopeptide transport system permease protein
MTSATSIAATRRRKWSEHPLSLVANVSWVLTFLGAMGASLIDGVSASIWLGIALLAGVSLVLTLLIRSTLVVPVDSKAMLTNDQGTSLWKDAWRRWRRNQMATGSMVILMLIASFCFSQHLLFHVVPKVRGKASRDFAADSFYSLHIDHTRTHEGQTYEPPSPRHWFGTDSLGRDLFARTLFGGGISFLVGIVGTIVSVVVGVSWGAVAGYVGGRVDSWMMRTVDILYGLPFLFLVILIMTLVNGLGTIASKAEQKDAEAKLAAEKGDMEKARILQEEIKPEEWTALWMTRLFPPIVVVFIAIGLVSWLTMARITRGQVLSLREREFVVAARAIGARPLRIIFLHIVPNLLGPVIVYSTLTIPEIMLSEAFLSFIGLGISEPSCSWGSLASEGLAGVNVIKPRWWLMFYPAAALSISLFCLNFIGDGLRDALDPKGARP